MLVVLEGLDGAGKSTQVKRLKAYLESVFGSLEYIHFPRYDAPVYGDLISRFLRGDFGSNETVHPQLVALLFAEDRHGAAPEMKKVLAAGGTVLLDRYVYSNIAYQCAKVKDSEEAADLREWIFNTEYGDFDLPRPDLNIFLDVRQKARGKTALAEGRPAYCGASVACRISDKNELVQPLPKDTHHRTPRRCGGAIIRGQHHTADRHLSAGHDTAHLDL